MCQVLQAALQVPELYGHYPVMYGLCRMNLELKGNVDKILSMATSPSV